MLEGYGIILLLSWCYTDAVVMPSESRYQGLLEDCRIMELNCKPHNQDVITNASLNANEIVNNPAKKLYLPPEMSAFFTNNVVKGGLAVGGECCGNS